MNRLVSLCLKKDPGAGRPPFIYCSSSLTARILRRSVRDYLEQPAVQANSVLAIKQLFNPDGIVLGFNPSLVEECWGGSVEYPDELKLPVCTRPGTAEQFLRTKALEALVQAVRWARKVSGETAIIAAVPGISYFSAGGDEGLLCEMVAKVGVAVAGANPDVVAVFERSPLPVGYEAGLEPLLNVLEHYGIIAMLVLSSGAAAGATDVKRFGSILVDYHYLPAVDHDPGKIWGVMLDVGTVPPELAPGARFVSTPWEVAGESPVSGVREMRSRLEKIRIRQ